MLKKTQEFNVLKSSQAFIKLYSASFFIASTVFLSVPVFAQSNKYECVAEPKSQRLVYQSVAGVPTSFKPKLSRYVNSYTPVDVLVDVRSEFTGKTGSFIRIKKALNIPLYSLKTKTYLKNKRVILIGTGLDDFFLEQEITKLQQLGFRSLKIMRFGITALLGSDRLVGSKTTSLKLKTASAQDVVSASIGQGQSFLFINLDKQSDVYRAMGLKSLRIPFSNESSFYKNLYALAQKEYKKNDLVRIVLVHDDPSVYQTVFHSKHMFDMQGLLFVEGGNAALLRLQKQLAQTTALSQKIKRSCTG